VQTTPSNDSQTLTTTSSHAQKRMQHRGIDTAAIEAAMAFGREVFTRGAIVHAIGRREIEQWRDEGINLSAYDGVQVVCSHDGAVLTVYRNRSFRGLRPGLGRGRCAPSSLHQSA
jgi:hypothetical protein